MDFKNDWTRRQFLKSASTTLAVTALGETLLSALAGDDALAAKKTLAGAPFYACGYKKGPMVHPREALGDNYISLMAQDGREPTLIKVKPDIHSVAVNPKDPNLCYGFAKEQPFACAVDLRNPKGVRTIDTRPGLFSSGHGVCTPDGKWLLTSEVDEASRNGFIVTRNAKTLKFEAITTSHGKYPHELKFLPDKKTLVVANGGDGESSFVFMEYPSGKLLDKIPSVESFQKIRHFTLGLDGKFAIAGWPVGASVPNTTGYPPARVMHGFRAAGKTHMEILDIPPEVNAGRTIPIQYLSIALNPRTNIAGTTCEDNGTLIFFDMNTMKFIKFLEMTHPKGIAVSADQKHYAVSGMDGMMHFIDADTLKIVPEKSINAMMNNSHLTAWQPAV